LDRLAEKGAHRFRKPIFANYSILPVSVEAGQFDLIKPLTYMNRSGAILSPLFKKTGLGLGNVLVICDHLDLPVGICRLKRKGSSGGHRGLQSIIDESGTEDFLRLYVGIGRPEDDTTIHDYVLGDPSQEEKLVLDAAVEKAAEAVLKLQKEPPEQVMNELNRRE
jgi:PTH1 family peptidyl-tRNA hydrolase